MMKKLFFICFFLPLFALAQNEIKHTVAAKESLTSIGRLYNINGRVLAEYNHIDYDKGLSIGQVLRIPVSGNTPTPPPPTPTSTTSGSQNGNPIYHTVTQGEGLYGISKKYNTEIADIKKWNGLNSDLLDLGMRLIVGYSGNVKATPANEVETPSTPEPVVQSEPKNPVQVTPATPPTQTSVQSEGIFKSDFSGAKGKKQTGEVRIFKSTSGWEDTKFYCLHDTAPIGGIVKITNTSNGKIIFAKVLDIIPELTENNNSILILSNAGANALGIETATVFNAQVEW